MQEDSYIGEFIFSWKQSWGTNENVSDTRWAQLESMWRRHKREDSHILFLINTMWWFWPSEQQNKKLKEQLVLLLLWNENLFCLYQRAQETRKRQAAFVRYEVIAWWLWILCGTSHAWCHIFLSRFCWGIWGICIFAASQGLTSTISINHLQKPFYIILTSEPGCPSSFSQNSMQGNVPEGSWPPSWLHATDLGIE